MSIKERIYQIVEGMSDDQASVLLMDLEEAEPRAPLTEDEQAEIIEAREELRSGQGIPLDEAMRRLRAVG